MCHLHMAGLASSGTVPMASMYMSATTTETRLPMGACSMDLFVELLVKLEVCGRHDELQQAHDIIWCEVCSVFEGLVT